jgi:hypothetical protein
MSWRKTSALAATLAALSATPALAAETVGSQLSIRQIRGPGLGGRVTSATPSCVHHRKVRLYYDDGSGFVLLGADTSNGKGRWKLYPPHGSIRAGDYYARAKGTNRAGVRCAPARSATISL